MKLNSRNVYSVLVNAQNQLLVRGEVMDIEDLKENTKIFILNPQQLTNMSESPTKALISIKNDRGTKYETYLEVYNELKAAYNELWEEAAMTRFGKNLDECTGVQQKEIRDAIPLLFLKRNPRSSGRKNNS